MGAAAGPGRVDGDGGAVATGTGRLAGLTGIGAAVGLATGIGLDTEFPGMGTATGTEGGRTTGGVPGALEGDGSVDAEADRIGRVFCGTRWSLDLDIDQFLRPPAALSSIQNTLH
jgi:hypothetical protein